MSTATMRLRRAGAGGLAAAVIAGTLIAGAGAAQAALAATVANVNSPTGTTVYVGGTAQSGDDIKITLPTTWSIGDQVIFDLPGTCATAAATVGLSGTPTGTAALGSGAASTDVLPKFNITTATGTAAGCSTAAVTHQFTVTLTNDAASQTVAPSITLTSVKYNIGSGVSTGALNLTVGGGATPATLQNATIANTKLATTGVVPATTGSSAVALGNITASDIGSSVITSKLFFHASGSYYFGSATPKVTGGGLTWTVAGMGTQTLTATGTGTLTSAANTFVLSGATLGTTTNTNPVGVAAVTASFGATYPGTTIGTVNVASVVTQSRVGGSDRYATAAALFNKNFAPTTTVNPNAVAVLASGANFPDALSATFLAAQEKTGTLLTTPLALPSVTLNSLITNKIATVYIVGGPGAVSNGVANQIAATHVANIPTNAFINVVRVWGADRYATNKAVNEYNFASQPTAIIATGENFADALSVGPAVYDQQYPLVLTTTAALSASASQQLTDMGTKNVVIVGGTGAVSSAVETSLKGMGITIVARLAGTDRTQTAAAIATWETNATTATPVAGLGFDQSLAHVSNGANFPDALAAGPVAGMGTNVILLSASPTSLGAGAPEYLGGLNTSTSTTVDTLNALGLTGAVSPAVMNAAAVALAG